MDEPGLEGRLVVRLGQAVLLGADSVVRLIRLFNGQPGTKEKVEE